MKKVNQKGFTLAELLIVVAIIAVLVAVAIPTFTNQLEKAREATDIANLRSAYAEIVTKALENPQEAVTLTVNLKQSQKGWQTSSVEIAGTSIKEAIGEGIPTANGSIKVVYTPSSDESVPASITIAGVTITGTFDASDGSDATALTVTIPEVTITSGNEVGGLTFTVAGTEEDITFTVTKVVDTSDDSEKTATLVTITSDTENSGKYKVTKDTSLSSGTYAVTFTATDGTKTSSASTFTLKVS